jgi:hypothetical protein
MMLSNESIFPVYSSDGECNKAASGIKIKSLLLSRGKGFKEIS